MAWCNRYPGRLLNITCINKRNFIWNIIVWKMLKIILKKGMCSNIDISAKHGSTCAREYVCMRCVGGECLQTSELEHFWKYTWDAISLLKRLFSSVAQYLLHYIWKKKKSVSLSTTYLSPHPHPFLFLSHAHSVFLAQSFFCYTPCFSLSLSYSCLLPLQKEFRGLVLILHECSILIKVMACWVTADVLSRLDIFTRHSFQRLTSTRASWPSYQINVSTGRCGPRRLFLGVCWGTALLLRLLRWLSDFNWSSCYCVSCRYFIISDRQCSYTTVAAAVPSVITAPAVKEDSFIEVFANICITPNWEWRSRRLLPAAVQSCIQMWPCGLWLDPIFTKGEMKLPHQWPPR